MKHALIRPVILCGGAGSRLWPASREAFPKQFLPLFGGQSLFDLTLQRISNPSLFAPPAIVSAEPLLPFVTGALKKAGMTGTVILEPCRRNTAPAIAVAIEITAPQTPETMLVLASDHFIEDVAAFHRAVQESAAQAELGRIITFGVEPDHPHTGYGYIEKGERLTDGVFAISRFIEKPEEATARELLARGCLWNSGNFLFRSDVMRQEIASYEPKIAQVAQQVAAALAPALAPALTDGIAVHAIPDHLFARAPEISIDYAVLERSHRGACKSVSYRWSDMGTWNALWSHFEKDAAGNALKGGVTLYNTENALVFTEAQHVAVVGMSDVAVVVTKDAILVAPRSVSSELSAVVKSLKADPATAPLTMQVRDLAKP